MCCINEIESTIEKDNLSGLTFEDEDSMDWMVNAQASPLGVQDVLQANGANNIFDIDSNGF